MGRYNLDRFSFNGYSFTAWELTRSVIIYSLKNRKLKIRDFGPKSQHGKSVFLVKIDLLLYHYKE